MVIRWLPSISPGSLLAAPRLGAEMPSECLRAPGCEAWRVTGRDTQGEIRNGFHGGLSERGKSDSGLDPGDWENNFGPAGRR